MKMSTDVYIGAIGILLSIIVWWVTSLFPVFNVQELGPAFFPRVLAIALAFFCSILIYTAVRASKREESKSEAPPESENVRRLLWVIVYTILYYIGILWVGYIISSVVYIIGLTLLYQEKKKLLPALGESIALVAVVYVIFVIVLQFPLPSGRLF